MLEFVTNLMKSIQRVGESPRDLLPSTFPCTTNHYIKSTKGDGPKILSIRICTDENLVLSRLKRYIDPVLGPWDSEHRYVLSVSIQI